MWKHFIVILFVIVISVFSTHHFHIEETKNNFNPYKVFIIKTKKNNGVVGEYQEFASDVN